MVREAGVQSLIESYQRLKIVFDATLLYTQHYRVWIKGKVEQSKEWSSAFPTPRCSSYWKGSHRVAADYSRQQGISTPNGLINTEEFFFCVSK